MSFALVVLLAVAWPLDHRLLAVEDARGDATLLVTALDRGPTRLQAIRALGRFERPELAPHLVPFLSEPDPDVRIETANALAQMAATERLAPFLDRERDPRVRGAIYEALGRLPEGTEALLLPGLSEGEPVRRGAVQGLETFYRSRGARPSPAAVEALRSVVTDSRDPATIELALLALLRAEKSDAATLDTALEHSDPRVRRLAVRALSAFRDDESPRVRFESLRTHPTCGRAEKATDDPDGHVALLAIDLLADGCSADLLERILDERDGWRRQAHALVSLAKRDPERARPHLSSFAARHVWQARAYAARAAKLVADEPILSRLRKDAEPNVVAEALVTPEQALAALDADHYGLLVAALELIEREGLPDASAPKLLQTLKRLTAERKRTSRDPRRLLLERLKAAGEPSIGGALDFLLGDFDPQIARLAAEVASELSGRPVAPKTTRFAPDPLPEQSALLALRGARARIQMREAGSFVIELLPEVAPLTVAKFAQLAESGYYDGLTFHRVVPGFVIQGGSPGANEYVGTPGYLRDEVSTLSHTRGTLGISTRGRDTGDGQIFVDLEDNFRLDHNYTVFARVVEGMSNVDRVLEGDVMERVELIRAGRD